MKQKKLKLRNWVAVAAFQHGGSGKHADKKKKSNKLFCRKKFRV